MTRETFERRTKHIVKNSNGYRYAERLMSGEKVVRTCHTSGSGRFTTNIDRTDETIDVLRAAGLKRNRDFVVGNDSPRGGLVGNYIKLLSRGSRKRF